MQDPNEGYSENKLIYLPDNFEDVVQIVGKGIIVKATKAYNTDKSKGGIVLIESKNDVYEKKYDIGEVVAVGPDVSERIRPGVIVIYQRSRAFRMPNAEDKGNDARYHKLEETILDIICILPNPEKAKE